MGIQMTDNIYSFIAIVSIFILLIYLMKTGPTERSCEVLWYGLPSPLAPGPYEDRLCPFIRIYGSEKTSDQRKPQNLRRQLSVP